MTARLPQNPVQKGWEEAERLMQGSREEQIQGARIHAGIVIKGETLGRQNGWQEWGEETRTAYVDECARGLGESETSDAGRVIERSWNDPSPSVRKAGTQWELIFPDKEDAGEDVLLRRFWASKARNERWRTLIDIAQRHSKVSGQVLECLGWAVGNPAKSGIQNNDVQRIRNIAAARIHKQGGEGRAARFIARSLGIENVPDEEREKQPKKNQHYVPELTQKQWRGKDGKVTKMIVKSGAVERTGTRRNWVGEYFYEQEKYSDTKGVEDSLADIEAGWGTLAKEIVETNGMLPRPGTPAWEWIKFFACAQFARTDQAAANVQNLHEELLRKEAEWREANSQFGNAPGLKIEDLENMVDEKWARRSSLQSIFGGMLEGTADLQIVVLESRRERVLLPDTGVWRENLYATEGVPWGMGSIGAMLIMPLSPRLTLVICDGQAYEWYGKQGWPPKYEMLEVDEIALAQAAMHHALGEVLMKEKQEEWVLTCRNIARREIQAYGRETRRIPGLRVHSQLAKKLHGPEVGTGLRLYGLPLRGGLARPEYPD